MAACTPVPVVKPSLHACNQCGLPLGFVGNKLYASSCECSTLYLLTRGHRMSIRSRAILSLGTQVGGRSGARWYSGPGSSAAPDPPTALPSPISLRAYSDLWPQEQSGMFVLVVPAWWCSRAALVHSHCFGHATLVPGGGKQAELSSAIAPGIL